MAGMLYRSFKIKIRSENVLPDFNTVLSVVSQVLVHMLWCLMLPSALR